jgi:hypothetical protein
VTTEDSITDNVLQTLQQLVQDVIAPDVRELLDLRERIAVIESKLATKAN